MTLVQGKKSNKFAFASITFLFFAWGFITCMNDLLIPKFKADFNLTQFQANLIQSAFFGAFFLISLFYYIYSSIKEDPINKMGYKNSLVLGLVICGLGCFLFYPAAITHTYFLFLFALLTLGSGVTIIQIAANPYVSILGEAKTATSRLNLAQGVNSLGYVIAPVVGGLLLFGKDVYNNSAGVDSVKTTYLGLGACFVVLALIIKNLDLPDFKQDNSEDVKFEIFADKKFVMGLLAIFFYVGSEVTIGSILINYLGDKSIIGIPAHEADKYLSFYWGGLMIGRLVGAIALSSMVGKIKAIWMISISILATLIIYGTATFKNFMTSGEFISFYELAPYFGTIILSLIFFLLAGKSANKLIAIFSLTSAVLVIISMLATGQLALWSIIGIGLFNSIMWSNIFTISIEGMKEKTSKASSLLVMMIVGGAILPAVQGALADMYSIRASLVIVLVGYGYLGLFGMFGKKAQANAEL